MDDYSSVPPISENNEEENNTIFTGLRRRRNTSNNYVMNNNEKPVSLVSENENRQEQFVEDPLNFDPPEEFICPLTKKVMIEPTTILQTGVNCEKAAYISYIRKGGVLTCPKTLEQLSSIEYESNTELMKKIGIWMNSTGKIWRGYDDWIYHMNGYKTEKRAFKQIS